MWLNNSIFIFSVSLIYSYLVTIISLLLLSFYHTHARLLDFLYCREIGRTICNKRFENFWTQN